MVPARPLGDDVVPQTGPVLFLMGPTASGKTELAAALSNQFDLEIISVDAAQVYRGMNIGTAKPSKEFMDRYPHHLVDIREPQDTFNAADFVAASKRLIREIQARGRTPLLVGGTMFYFDALERGLAELPAADSETRAAVALEIAERGIAAMYDKLTSIDPVTAARIDPGDIQRVQRALEIYQLAGVPPSVLMTRVSGMARPPLKLALFDSDRARLHARIAERFNHMLDLGLVEEVEGLVHGCPGFVSSPAARIVGYRQTLAFLDGSIDRGCLTDRGVAATRQLAKRQLTWMRQQSGLVWCDIGPGPVAEAVCTFLRSGVFSGCH